MIKNLLVLWMFTVLAFAATEKDYQTAWNNQVIHGVTEYAVPFGRVDVLTTNYAIEIDHVAKFHEAIGQALHYAYATSRNPGIALIMDGKKDTPEKYAYAKKLAEHYGIKVWLINKSSFLPR